MFRIASQSQFWFIVVSITTSIHFQKVDKSWHWSNLLFPSKIESGVNLLHSPQSDEEDDKQQLVQLLQFTLSCWELLQKGQFHGIHEEWMILTWDIVQFTIADALFCMGQFANAKQMYHNLWEIWKNTNIQTSKNSPESFIARNIATKYSKELSTCRLALQIGICATIENDIRVHSVLQSSSSQLSRKLFLNVLQTLPFTNQNHKTVNYSRDPNICFIALSDSGLTVQVIGHLLHSYQATKEWGKVLVLSQFAWPLFEQYFQALVRDPQIDLQLSQYFQYIVNILTFIRGSCFP